MSSPTRTLTIRLAPFERDALDRYGAAQRVPAARAVRTAILYYLRERGSNRPTWAVLPDGVEEAASDVQVELELGEEAWRALVDEAACQAVAPETLARHALVFFLADFDSGRVAAAVERALRNE
jgi:hypothetical protein